MRHGPLLVMALVASGLGGASAGRSSRVVVPDSVSILIYGGTIVDGTGARPRIADVAIRDDRILWIAAPAGTDRPSARRTIDARGLIVSPGFIDPHTHTEADLTDPVRRKNLNYLAQGVTTVVTGNDGGGPINVAERLAKWEHTGIGTNAALLVGHGTVRGTVLGMSEAAPDLAQLARMRSLVDSAMRGGALGLSSGLYYAPGSYAATDEVIVLAQVASGYGGIYDSHIRDESSYTIGLLAAVAEALRIGREAKIPVHISHIKALGADVWGQSDSVIALVRQAQREGVVVSADQYPYLASGTSLGAALLPRWAEVGGRDSLVARLHNPATHPRLVKEMTENLRRRGGAESLLFTGTQDTRLRTKTLAQVAATRRISPTDAAIGVIIHGDVGVASFNMNESDLERFMVQDFVSTGSDGSDGHPRKFGTFPRKFREFVQEKGLMSLAQFVESSSRKTAEAFHIHDRGVLRAGAFADVVVIDTATYRDRATYIAPDRLANGVSYVVLNGEIVIDHGRQTGVLAGRVIRREVP